MMDISLVVPGQVVAVTARILPYLQVSAEWSKGRSSADDIVRFVLNGQMQLWAVFDETACHGHIVTEIKQYPQCKFLTIQYCAMEPGTMAAVEDKMQEYAERFARDAGCTGIEFIGRPGWRKTANQYGYELHSVTYQKIFKE
jgi:hypothetical protein